MKPEKVLTSFLAFTLIGFQGCSPKAKPKTQALRFVEAVNMSSLATVVSVEVSPDDRHLYAAAYTPASLTVFDRDRASGRLTHVQTLTDPSLFDGVACVRVSDDGRHAAAAAFRSETVVLLQRDADSGKLEVRDVARQGDDSVDGLGYVIELAFSPDSRFIYALGDRSGALSVFAVTGSDELELVQTHFGEGGCFDGARGIAISSDGKAVFVASSRADALVSLEREATSGKVTIKHIVRDDTPEAHALAGAFSVACSPDGRNVYVSAGRFRGDNAVSVFRRTEDGRLEPVQEVFDGRDGLHNFAGGNEVAVTPDGLAVYALGSVSHSIACFERDSQTGRLTHPATVGGMDQVGSLGSVSGIDLSADGRFVYAAAERDSAISVFER